MNDDPEPLKVHPRDRLGRLVDAGEHRAFSQAYSRFVRLMRLILPLLAAAIIGLLMSWPRLEETMERAPAQAVVPVAAARNELLNPHFESIDGESRPYQISAGRAVQSTHDPDTVILEAPRAGITMEDGTQLAAKAEKGAYQQKEERLLLEGNVTLLQSEGYEVKTAKLLVNMKSRKAWSDQPVTAAGPAGTIEATGLQAASEEGKLIFTGPAKLVLKQSVKGL